MIRKIVQVHHIDHHSEIRQNLEYWLGRPPEERIAAVEKLRRQAYDELSPIQRTVQVIRQLDD